MLEAPFKTPPKRDHTYNTLKALIELVRYVLFVGYLTHPMCLQ